jgi:hypothetical protein
VAQQPDIVPWPPILKFQDVMLYRQRLSDPHANSHPPKLKGHASLFVTPRRKGDPAIPRCTGIARDPLPVLAKIAS